jgi:hypothetical protein
MGFSRFADKKVADTKNLEKKWVSQDFADTKNKTKKKLWV